MRHETVGRDPAAAQQRDGPIEAESLRERALDDELAAKDVVRADDELRRPPRSCRRRTECRRCRAATGSRAERRQIRWRRRRHRIRRVRGACSCLRQPSSSSRRISTVSSAPCAAASSSLNGRAGGNRDPACTRLPEQLRQDQAGRPGPDDQHVASRSELRARRGRARRMRSARPARRRRHRARRRCGTCRLARRRIRQSRRGRSRRERACLRRTAVARAGIGVHTPHAIMLSSAMSSPSTRPTTPSPMPSITPTISWPGVSG